MILCLLFVSPYLSAVCFLTGLLLMRRGSRRGQRERVGILLTLAAVGFAWAATAFMLGGLIGRLLLLCILIMAALLIGRHWTRTS